MDPTATRLVVADWTIDAETVATACRDRGSDHALHLLVPAWLHGLDWAGDPWASVPCAHRQLERLAQHCTAAGLRVARAEVGDPDPLSAIGDAVASGTAAEILLFARGRHVAARPRCASPPAARAQLSSRHVAPHRRRGDVDLRAARAGRSARRSAGRAACAPAARRALRARPPMAILGKLDSFRGASRFTTWAYKFALLEAGVKARRRAWQGHEIGIDSETWPDFADAGPSAHAQLEDTELLGALREAVRTCLTPRQREVFAALALNSIPIDVLAERLGTTRGALYKTLHDARRKLRAALEAAGETTVGR